MAKSSFLQKVINALKFSSDEYVNEKIETKLSPNEKILG